MSAQEIARLMDPSTPDIAVTVRKNDLLAFAKMLMGGDRRTGGDAWLNAKEVSEVFGLAYNNVKDSAWRKKKNFPTHQPGGSYSKPMFRASEISEWLAKQ